MAEGSRGKRSQGAGGARGRGSSAGASRNGSGAGARGSANGSSVGDITALIARAVGAVASQAQLRVPRADLDERDPDYIRESLPRLWLLASLWFRGEVRGLERIPPEGPVLLVGNHSGGNLTPDTSVFTLAFNTYFGVERRFYQLAHNLVLSMPGLGFLRKYGTVAASPQNANAALDSGAALLVYPGGDYEVHRPTRESAKVDFGGRKGFIRLALDKDVPIVPVVSVGGQETALFLSRGEWLAKLLRLDRMFRLKVLPISLALPWGLNVGDMLGHIPAPAKITIQVLQPIHLRERYGQKPDLDEVVRGHPGRHAGHAHRTSVRAVAAGGGLTGEARGAGRDRRVLRGGVGAAPRPGGHPALRARDHQVRPPGRRRRGAGPGRALCDAHAGGLGRGRRADRDRGVRPGARHRVDEHHRHRPAWPLAATQRGRRAHARVTEVELRIARGVDGDAHGHAVRTAGARSSQDWSQESEGANRRGGGSGRAGQGIGGQGGSRARIGEDPPGRGDRSAGPAGQARPGGAHADEVGARPGRRLHLGSGDLARRARDRGRPRHAHLRRDRPPHERPRPRLLRPGRQGGRRRGHHVPQPPRFRGGHGGRGQARRARALPEHGVRRSAAGRGGEAREARSDRLRRGVHRPARGCRHAPQAIHRLARIGSPRRPNHW